MAEIDEGAVGEIGGDEIFGRRVGHDHRVNRHFHASTIFRRGEDIVIGNLVQQVLDCREGEDGKQEHVASGT